VELEPLELEAFSPIFGFMAKNQKADFRRFSPLFGYCQFCLIRV
jgi:hypothetical protein